MQNQIKINKNKFFKKNKNYKKHFSNIIKLPKEI